MKIEQFDGLFGFEYKGVHSNDIGIIMRTVNRPLLPNQKVYEVDLPAQDGTIDFSAANINKRNVYQDRIIELELDFIEVDLYALQTKASKVAMWLSGQGELKFDDAPMVHWNGKIITQIDFAPILNGQATRLKVYFKCSAWGQTDFTTAGPILDDRIALDTAIPLDLSEYFTFNVENGTNTLTIKKFGTWYAKPVIHVAGAGSCIRVASPLNENHSISVLRDFDNLKIDFIKQRVYDGAEDITSHCVGNFFELPPGEYDLIVDYEGDGAVVFVEFTPQWLYGADIEGLFEGSDQQ